MRSHETGLVYWETPSGFDGQAGAVILPMMFANLSHGINAQSSTSGSAVRVLVCSGDLFHEPAIARNGLEKVIKAPDVTVDWCECTSLPDAPGLLQYSLVVLAKANVLGPCDRRAWLPKEDTRLSDFVAAGGWLLVVHSGLSGYASVPSLRAVTGGAFAHHPPPCSVQLEGVGPPLFTGGVEFPFTVIDEHYFVEGERGSEEVFLVSRSVHGVQDAGWTRRVGRGRVVVLTPGHFVEVWRHPGFARIVSNIVAASRDPVIVSPYAI